MPPPLRGSYRKKNDCLSIFGETDIKKGRESVRRVCAAGVHVYRQPSDQGHIEILERRWKMLNKFSCAIARPSHVERFKVSWERLYTCVREAGTTGNIEILPNDGKEICYKHGQSSKCKPGTNRLDGKAAKSLADQLLQRGYSSISK
jgi:ATP-dependent helicase YprA (DUF1998 family)